MGNSFWVGYVPEVPEVTDGRKVVLSAASGGKMVAFIDMCFFVAMMLILLMSVLLAVGAPKYSYWIVAVLAFVAAVSANRVTF
jgi:hypothetical protein